MTDRHLWQEHEHMAGCAAMKTKLLCLMLLCLAPSMVDAGGAVGPDCSFKGKKLHGKVKVVTNFPDIKVKVVSNFADLHVKKVENFPDTCGKWKIVENFEDFKVQFVDNFPDIKIKYVDNFPGVP